jgi:hypothetical protein
VVSRRKTIALDSQAQHRVSPVPQVARDDAEQDDKDRPQGPFRPETSPPDVRSSQQYLVAVGKGFVQIGDWLYPVPGKPWWRRILMGFSALRG